MKFPRNRVIAGANGRLPFSKALIGILATVVASAAVRADEYSTIAGAVASPLVSNAEDLDKAYADGQVMMRIELARQRLQSVSPSAPELSAARRNILQQLESCHSAMDEIRRISGKLPDYEKIAKKAIEASPALVRTDPATGDLTHDDQNAVEELAGTLIKEGLKVIVDAWNLSKQCDNYCNHCRSARMQSLALAEIAKSRCTGKAAIGYGIGIAVEINEDSIVVAEAIANGPAAKAGLRAGDELIAVDGKQVKRRASGTRKIDDDVFLSLGGPRDSKFKLTYARGGINNTVELSRTFAFNEDLLDIDFDGSWNATFPHDSLALRNISGKDLTHCTLLVTLIGTHGDGDEPVHQRHLHYVEKWTANQQRFARYPTSTAEGITTGESIDRVQKLVIEFYSDQVRGTVEYQYAGTRAFDEDVDRYVGMIRQKQTFNLTFIGDTVLTNAGITLQHDGPFRIIPDPKLTVKVSRGKDVRTVVWRSSGKPWNSGTFSAYALKDPSFNGPDPDQIEVEFEFPGSTKKLARVWRFSSR
jgi:hypothetical protein